MVMGKNSREFHHEKLGTAFTFVRNDVLGNIEKIERRFYKDPTRYHFIRAILEEDAGKKMSEGCVGLLWLMRGLMFVHRLFFELIEDHRNGVTSDDIGPAIRRAYDASLRAYHGWLMQKTISGITRILPGRKEFLRRLFLHNSATVDNHRVKLKVYGGGVEEGNDKGTKTTKEIWIKIDLIYVVSILTFQVVKDIQLYDVNLWATLQLMEKQINYYGRNEDEKA
ncbi:glycolipid transfer protein 1-like isoform X2 [Pomacea canaliculata]|uniref:glycolipid transfer protein 1-like isoform X2 n=1 Tax=Pomacea canaliculata TaxID=400727 RepID=UPI000D7312E1|nr:glycolipid transfer protein 1-like isoform X2 [Pomacea canaliculata]